MSRLLKIGPNVIKIGTMWWTDVPCQEFFENFHFLEFCGEKCVKMSKITKNSLFSGHAFDHHLPKDSIWPKIYFGESKNPLLIREESESYCVLYSYQVAAMKL